MAIRVYATGSVLTLKDDNWDDEVFVPYANLVKNGDEFSVHDLISVTKKPYIFDYNNARDEAGAVIGGGTKDEVSDVITNIIFA